MNKLPPQSPTPPPSTLYQQLERATPQRRIKPVDLSRVDSKVLESAQGLEALFLNELTRAMRKNVPSSEMSLENSATKIYRDQLDSQLSQQAAEADGLGLAQQYIEYLHASGYPIYKEEPTPSAGLNQHDLREGVRVGTGGTNESE